MENKPQNVFDKLDKQSTQIDDISSKLEGISVNDLYALAKRTWDYGDFETAQKYYNHISLLKPLDWEAPLYASLCNFGGYHDMIFWTHVPEQKEKIIISTIEYIDKLEMDSEKKESEMSKCIDIIKSILSSTKNHYFTYRNNYDDFDNSFIYTLEDVFLNIYSKVKDLKYSCIKDFMVFLADNLLDIISNVLKITSNVREDVYDELLDISSNKIECDYNELLNSSMSGQRTTEEEWKNIRLKGKLYCEYNDKVVAKRVFRNKLIIGISTIILSIFGMVYSAIYDWLFILWFVVPLIFGLIILIMAFSQKEKINCYSQFCLKRKRTRMTSDGKITVEGRNSFVKIFLYPGWIISGASLIYFFIVLFTINNIDTIPKVVLSITAGLLVILCFLSFMLLTTLSTHDETTYMYYYNGKFYSTKEKYY